MPLKALKRYRPRPMFRIVSTPQMALASMCPGGLGGGGGGGGG